MDAPNFHSYFLTRIKLTKTVNEIHKTSFQPSLTPALASSTIKRWTNDFDMPVLLWREYIIRKTPGDGDTGREPL
ncbi:Hypothetical protein FKW44_017984 [Caligus rogercresseyi]|uniref:Uncharacterized protein n=1 Tax=Caligus rogercresseyi TaxID=217165 RepID=A0A7T8JX33_CALRO|nr:Hypothetical protein FKW44_017984 [Caligus rogercresseyi]